MKQDWERDHLKEVVFLAEEQAEMEKEFYLWMQNNNYDNTGEAATIIGERIGHESLSGDILPSEWGGNKPATIKSEGIQLGNYVREERAGS